MFNLHGLKVVFVFAAIGVIACAALIGLLSYHTMVWLADWIHVLNK